MLPGSSINLNYSNLVQVEHREAAAALAPQKSYIAAATINKITCASNGVRSLKGHSRKPTNTAHTAAPKEKKRRLSKETDDNRMKKRKENYEKKKTDSQSTKWFHKKRDEEKGSKEK